MILPEIKSIETLGDGRVVVRHAGKPGEFVYHSMKHLQESIDRLDRDIDLKVTLALALSPVGDFTKSDTAMAVGPSFELKK